ncbi:MAG: 50S ribosomal protein L13 [Phycisphaerales bacterium]
MAATHLRRDTYIAKPGDKQRDWHIIDATNVPMGRLSAAVATVLMGKHRPEYTPHIDTGDFVIVINAEKVGLTGKKASHKFDKRYSGYPGGQKLESYGHLRERRPERLIELGVRRMLPKSRLGRQMLKKMKVYAGSEHPHAGVNAVELKV